MIIWPEFKFPPVNLYSLGSCKYVNDHVDSIKTENSRDEKRERGLNTRRKMFDLIKFR